MAIPKGDGLWIALLIGAVVIINLWQRTDVTSSQAVAGPGTDPYDLSEYTPDALAFLGGAL